MKKARGFKRKEPKLEKVLDVINAGTEASSSGDLQNWRFVIVKDPDLRVKISNMCPKQEWIRESPYMIVVCADQSQIKKLYGARGEALYSIQNCASCVERMLLKAEDLTLDTRWIRLFDEEKLKQELNLPENIRPQAIVLIGYANKYENSLPKRSLKNMIWFETWGTAGKLRDTGVFPIQKHFEKLKNLIKKPGSTLKKIPKKKEL